MPALGQEAHKWLMQVRDGGSRGGLRHPPPPAALGRALEFDDAAHQLRGADELTGLLVGVHLLLQGPVVSPTTGAASAGQGSGLTPVGVQAEGTLAVAEARSAMQTNVRHLARLAPF